VPPPPRVSGGASGADFDYRQLVPSFIQTVREVLFNPVNFFRSIRREGDFLNPLLFAIICALFSGIINAILRLLINVVAGNGVGSAIANFIATLILVPIGTAIGLFIAAAIYHLFFLLIVRPSHAGYEATFRVVAYAAVLQLVSWLGVIPILGFIVLLAVLVYNVVLSVIGMREMHTTTTGRAVAVVVLPVVIVGLLIFLVGLTIAAIIIAALSAGQQ
jgi:hypothetical protein